MHSKDFFHRDLERRKSAFFIKTHGGFIEAPNVQCDVIAAHPACFFQHVLIEQGPNMPTAHLLVHAEIVDIKRFSVHEREIALDLLHDAEGIALRGIRFIHGNVDRCFFIREDGDELFLRVFFVAAAEEIGSAVGVDLMYLIEQGDEARNILFACVADGHHSFDSAVP